MALSVSAQADTTSPPCRGEVISSIVVRTERSSERERLRKYGPVGGIRALMYRNTSWDVIRRYLYLRAGDRCSEFARSESERVLRAKPFLANARVRVVPLAKDSIMLDVATEDELPLNLSGHIHRSTLAAVRVGNSNVLGSAISVSLSYEQGFAYRDGYGLQITDNQAFNRPWLMNLEGFRDPLGSRWNVSLQKPSFSNLHPRSWYVGASGRRAFQALQRVDGPNVSVSVDRRQWIAGMAWRLGDRTRPWLAGPLAEGEYSDGVGQPAIITDTGFIPFTGLPERDYRYRSFRVGGLLGKRNIGHVPVFGFDALRSWQDVATGVEAVTYAAKSVSALNDLDRDVIIGGSLYAGTASPSSLLAMQADAEGSRKSDGKWQGVLVSGRGAWYNSASYYRTEMLSIEFAGTWSPRLPTQLTLSDYTLGLRGFRRAHIGGARRFVARAEERWVINQPIEKADFGIAAFADAGRLWAGDAPFGETTKWQASVGVSLLGAVPRGSRRTFRLDFAVPLTHAGNPARFEVRASVADLTRHFWREPGDMQRAREAGVFPRVLGN